MVMVVMKTMMTLMMIMSIPHSHDLGHVQLQPHVRGGVHAHGGAAYNGIKPSPSPSPSPCGCAYEERAPHVHFHACAPPRTDKAILLLNIISGLVFMKLYLMFMIMFIGVVVDVVMVHMGVPIAPLH